MSPRKSVKTTLGSRPSRTIKEQAGTIKVATKPALPRKRRASITLPTLTADIPTIEAEPTTINPDDLEVYLRNPADHDNIVHFNDDFVIIRDKYPKATIHLLVLPRDQDKINCHPLDVFKDDAFLSKCKEAASEWRRIAGKMLKKIICPDNDLDHDWEAEIMVGIHSVPSMSTLHIHVISRDLHSEFLHLRTNYTSFTTVFFVYLERFPLSEEDERECIYDLRRRDMTCWRCKKKFTKFNALKTHLEEEFIAWKANLISKDPRIRKTPIWLDCDPGHDDVLPSGRFCNIKGIRIALRCLFAIS
jgi:aprataxin